ncbi:uncharacterized protein LOC108838581 isoform X2 [Raphanus sativus]|uniref:Uncharacterized protein LOC108838581 isoform X2 n=1 Tax=Raphanus sativus TaxID=3726 RepID=A0A9W3BUC0_RAPSA|nr:uncharacterized protein LOC108838581 isoform X2 [Raphanus sativus]
MAIKTNGKFSVSSANDQGVMFFKNISPGPTKPSYTTYLNPIKRSLLVWKCSSSTNRYLNIDTSGRHVRKKSSNKVGEAANQHGKKHMVTESFKLKKEESVDERLDLGDSEPGFDADHEYGEGEFEERELKQEEHGLVNQMDEKLEEETEADENAGEFTDDIGRG